MSLHDEYMETEPSEIRYGGQGINLTDSNTEVYTMQPWTGARTIVDIDRVYSVATIAREKLGDAASKPEHNLRLLVGHANFLDGLVYTLRDLNVKYEQSRSEEWAELLAAFDEDSDDGDYDDRFNDNEFDDDDVREDDEFDNNKSNKESSRQDSNEESEERGLDPPSVCSREKTATPLSPPILPSAKPARLRYLPKLNCINEECFEEQEEDPPLVADAVAVALQTLDVLQISATMAACVNNSTPDSVPQVAGPKTGMSSLQLEATTTVGAAS